jgi:hypothetical protein
MNTNTIVAAFLPILCGACMSMQRPPAVAKAPEVQATGTALFDRGMDFAHRGDTLRAEQYITLAVEAGFPRERSILPLVQVCIASSRLRAALGFAEPYLRDHPQAWRLRALVASIELALGHEQAALTELARVIAQHPEADNAHYLTAVIERDAFRDEIRTRTEFEFYVARQPHGPHAPEALAWLAEHPSAAAADTGEGEAQP